MEISFPFLASFSSIRRIVAAAGAQVAVLLLGSNVAASDLPHLRQQGTARQLIVDGQPFLIRGGELSNSHGEPDYLRSSWPKLKALNLNAVVAPVYWDVIEPAEGKFDFATVDGLIADARANDMRLVLLWFGSWKNSMSSYVPAWMKTNLERFPRARASTGQGMEILTPFASENRDTDARAFGALMRHLRETDGTQHTVILVQVENEIGMIPEARDRHPAADAAFAGPVPPELMDYIAKHRDTLAPELRDRWVGRGARAGGTWTDVFGEGAATSEIFMAWAFGRYVEAVAAAGRAEYALPLYVNAALIRPAYQPGQYPSAGPLPHLIDVWRAAAPTIDFISPDIYFPNFAEWADRYTRGGNPLFVPEALRSAEAAANNLYAFGARDGIGFCPFGIESIAPPAGTYLAASNDLIRQFTPLIVAHQGKGTMTALLPPAAEQRKPHEVAFGSVVLGVMYERLEAPGLADGVINEAGDRSASRALLPSGAIVIQVAPDEFIFFGAGVVVTFAASTPGDSQIGILNCEEGRYVDGHWQHIRWLNGDQTHQGRHLRLEPGRFAAQRIKLYRYR
jgi:beta-galactosidase GanA